MQKTPLNHHYHYHCGTSFKIKNYCCSSCWGDTACSTIGTQKVGVSFGNL